VTHINTSYLTVNEYKRAPTAINTSNLDYLAGLTDSSSQDAELANVIARASAWIDNYCQLPGGLAASVNTETRAVYLTRDGFLRIQPYNFPIIQLQSLQWRLYPNAAWTTVDINNIQVYDRYFENLMWFPFLSGPSLTVGTSYAYPVSVPYMPYVDPTTRANIEDLQVTVQYTYINGYPNTTLSADVTAGASTITVDDATGIIAGKTSLTMYDGGKTEKVTVQSIAGNVLTLTKPLIFAHSKGIAVSAIPADVKQACILVVNYLLKERGVNSITMEGVQNPQMQKYDDTADLDFAKSMLRQYRRVV
jgi:hypothetical protein